MRTRRERAEQLPELALEFLPHFGRMFEHVLVVPFQQRDAGARLLDDPVGEQRGGALGEFHALDALDQLVECRDIIELAIVDHPAEPGQPHCPALRGILQLQVASPSLLEQAAVDRTDQTGGDPAGAALGHQPHGLEHLRNGSTDVRRIGMEFLDRQHGNHHQQLGCEKQHVGQTALGIAGRVALERGGA